MKKIILSLLAAFGIFSASAAVTAPTYPGGDDALNAYISENIRYPEGPKEMGIEGVVSVSFMVKADGSIGNIKIKRMVDPDLESEAIRLVKGMPKWIPAEDNGAPVEQPAEVNVTFSLD